MKNYKSLLGLVLAFAMFVSLIACSGKESTSSEAPSDPSASTDSAGSESDDYDAYAGIPAAFLPPVSVPAQVPQSIQ